MAQPIQLPFIEPGHAKSRPFQAHRRLGVCLAANVRYFGGDCVSGTRSILASVRAEVIKIDYGSVRNTGASLTVDCKWKNESPLPGSPQGS